MGMYDPIISYKNKNKKVDNKNREKMIKVKRTNDEEEFFDETVILFAYDILGKVENEINFEELITLISNENDVEEIIEGEELTYILERCNNENEADLIIKSYKWVPTPKDDPEYEQRYEAIMSSDTRTMFVIESIRNSKISWTVNIDQLRKMIPIKDIIKLTRDKDLVLFYSFLRKDD